jgi:hypothetical protein
MSSDDADIELFKDPGAGGRVKKDMNASWSATRVIIQTQINISHIKPIPFSTADSKPPNK